MRTAADALCERLFLFLRCGFRCRPARCARTSWRASPWRSSSCRSR